MITLLHDVRMTVIQLLYIFDLRFKLVFETMTTV